MRPATAARKAHLLLTFAWIACVLMRCRAGFDGGAFVVPPVVLGASGGTCVCPFCLAARSADSAACAAAAAASLSACARRVWLELRRLPPIMGFVGSGPGLVIILA